MAHCAGDVAQVAQADRQRIAHVLRLQLDLARFVALLAATRIDTNRLNMSNAARIAGGTRRGCAWWQANRPQSRPSTTIDIDIDAATPMLRRYSRCTGETLRRACWLRSSAVSSGSTPGNTGTLA